IVRNHIIFSISKDTFHGSLRHFFHFSTNLSVSSRVFQSNCQIDYRNIRSRNSECHTSQFTIKLRNHFTYRFRSSGRRRNDILTSSTSTSPVLRRRSVNSFLSCSSRVNCSHQAFLDSPVVVQYFGDRCQTVCSTGS